MVGMNSYFDISDRSAAFWKRCLKPLKLKLKMNAATAAQTTAAVLSQFESKVKFKNNKEKVSKKFGKELKMTESLQAKVMFANDTQRPCIVPLLLPN